MIGFKERIVGWLDLGRYARWNSTTIRILGVVEILLALFMVMPAAYAGFAGEDPIPFVIPIPVLLIIGTAQCMLFRLSVNFRPIHGLTLIGLSWIAVFIVGSIPFILSGMPMVDSIYESVSGFTTTGSSIIRDVGEWPVSLMIWRGLTQWLGGIAVIAIFMYILPMFGMGRNFLTNELEGSGSSNYSMKVRKAAKLFLTVYVGLTVADFLLLIICQASFEDALCLCFTTISTGGLTMRNNSLADYNLGIQAVTMFFVFIGGVNFYLHFKALAGRNLRVYADNREFRILVCWFLFVTAVVYVLYAAPKIEAMGFVLEDNLYYFKDALFTVVSVGTTAGFTVNDYTLQSPITIFLLIILAVVGSSAGSTSGGMKIGRIRICLRFFANIFNNIVHPNAVYSVKVDDQIVDETRVLSAVSVVLMYMTTLLLATLLLIFLNNDWVTSIGLAVSSLTNLGISISGTGAFEDMYALSAASKMLLIVLMWLGRLEITLALVFFTPMFWKELVHNVRTDLKESRMMRNQ